MYYLKNHQNNNGRRLTSQLKVSTQIVYTPISINSVLTTNCKKKWRVTIFSLFTMNLSWKSIDFSMNLKLPIHRQWSSIFILRLESQRLYMLHRVAMGSERDSSVFAFYTWVFITKFEAWNPPVDIIVAHFANLLKSPRRYHSGSLCKPLRVY